MSKAPLIPRGLRAAAAAVAFATLVSACGANASDDASSTTKDGVTKVKIAQVTNGAGKETTISVEQQDDLRQQVPKSILDSGELTIGQGALPSGFPPLAFVGNDDETITGSEPDLGRLIAAVLGLKPVVKNATWDNLFVGIDNGTNDVGISNITDTEERKKKYDFASYRQDNLGIAVKADNDLEFTGEPEPLDGLKVAVSAGTNQEKILVEFSDKLKKAGKKGISITYFPSDSAIWTALESGQIDAYFGPNPGIAYREAQKSDTIRTAGTYSGAGASLQGLIAATTKKGNGLAKPLAGAINYLIENGQYEKWLAAYNLSNEAVKTSEVNPAGLPLDNS